ncbi:MAG: radical SAM protein [Coriobacteriia bacterium]|nr:radical SAM protein [Coriobacteriia bacterium]
MQKSSLLPTHCDWCPLACGANRLEGNSGLCGADDEIYVARHSLHHWEEPPISGKSGSGTIFFSNCSMKCIYCQNHKISFEGAGCIVSIEELIDMCQDLQNQGAMNINFVTGTHYRSQIISAVRQANLDIPVVWNTSGYETQASVSALSSIVDVWLTDFKYSDNDLCKKLSMNKIDNYRDIALEAISTMLDFCDTRKFDIFNEEARMTKGVIVRHLLLPGHLDNSKECLRLLYDNFGNEIKYSIMNQYTPCNKLEYDELNSSATEEEYEALLNYADELGIDDYYWQQGDTAKTSFIPDF